MVVPNIHDIDLDATIKALPVTYDMVTDIRTAKEFIHDTLITPDPAVWICRPSDAELYINGPIKSHFNFKAKDCKLLMTYFKEVAPKPRKEPKQKPKYTNHTAEVRAKLLGDLTEAVENAKESADPLDIDIDEKGIDPELIKKAEKTADKILRKGKPIKYILKTVEKKHIGDTKTEEAICISIAGQSCTNTAGIHITVNGESGSGKSDGFKKHMHLVPAKWKRETTLSAKALFYMNLKAGMIIYSDDTDMDPELSEVFKQSTTNYQNITYRTTVKDQNRLIVSIPPRINWYLTSVESHVSDQVLNRRLTVETDASVAQKQAIFNMQKSLEAQGINPNEVTFRVLVCRRMYAMIKEHLFNVRIPFAERIHFNDVSNSRIFPLFCDMIKGYTIFYYKQRKTDEKGNLVAEIEDFENARRLFDSRAENTVTKLTKPERDIVNYIIKHQGSNGCSISEISKGTKIKYQQVSRLIKGRIDRKDDDGGLLAKQKGMRKEDTSENEYIRSSDDIDGVLIGSTGRRSEKYFIDDVTTIETNFSNFYINLED